MSGSSTVFSGSSVVRMSTNESGRVRSRQHDESASSNSAATLLPPSSSFGGSDDSPVTKRTARRRTGGGSATRDEADVGEAGASSSSDSLRGGDFLGNEEQQQQGGVLRQRRKGSPTVSAEERTEKAESDSDSSDEMDKDVYRNVKLTLVEEILLLGLKDKEGYTSFWNDSISTGLRGAILVELALHHRIELEKTGMRKKPLVSRRVYCVDGSPTGDAILDEALKHIKENSGSFSVPSWIDFLTGDTWNPINFRFHMRNVRERLAKSLVDKGVCNTQKQNFFIFDMTTHPLSNGSLKQNLIKRIQSLLLTKWKSELRRFKPRCLALLYLAHASDVLDNALANLTYVDFDLASKHTRDLLSVDPDQEAAKYDNRMEVLWAVVSNYIK